MGCTINLLLLLSLPVITLICINQEVDCSVRICTLQIYKCWQNCFLTKFKICKKITIKLDFDVRNLLQQLCFRNTKPTDFIFQILFFIPQHLQHMFFLSHLCIHLRLTLASTMSTLSHALNVKT